MVIRIPSRISRGVLYKGQPLSPYWERHEGGRRLLGLDQRQTGFPISVFEGGAGSR